MRKVIIASAVALVLFIVGAFAASFTLNAEDVASGEDEVNSCVNSPVQVNFNLDSYSETANGWYVDTIDVVYTETTATACDDSDMTLVIELENGGTVPGLTVLTNFGADATPGIATFTPADNTLLAKDVGHAAVLIDGGEVSANSST